MIKKPMLSGSIEEFNDLKFPLMASPKLDGIRCLVIDGKCLSRSFKPIPNHFIRNWVEANLPTGMDGELIVPGKAFNEIQGDVMREEGEPDFQFQAFDLVLDETTKIFSERYQDLVAWELNNKRDRLVVVEHKMIFSLEELQAFTDKCDKENYEGVMVRSLSGPYKNGRSTEKEGFLLKIKHFKDSEARIIGFEEQLTNNNEKEEDELGHSKRSTHKENMVPNGHLGKFVTIEVGDVPWKGQQLLIGGAKGMTKVMRKEIWENQDKYLGKIVKYTYQPHGMKDLPRLPIWIGFRDERDMS